MTRWQRRPGSGNVPGSSSATGNWTVPADRALICLTAEVVQRPRVPDEIFQQARQFLTGREPVEVLQVTGTA